jgi:predicted metal-dependent hydrolase
MQLALPFDSAPTGLAPTRPRTDTRLDPPTSGLIFVRHPRARRYVIRVASDGGVRVTVPRGGSTRQGAAFAERERQWIEEQRRRVEQERSRRNQCPARTDPSGDDALRTRAVRELPRRLLELAAAHGLAVARVSVRNQRSRWGSCSRAGHICLNWRLVAMPPAVRDYVMIHELMHLRRLDHSPRFWKLVAAACPNYQTYRAWLRLRSDHMQPVDSTVDV